VQALSEYGGAVVMVSHDRHLLELTADRLVLVSDGTVKEFNGDLDDYRDVLLGRGGSGAGTEESATKAPKRGNRKDERRKAAQERERSKLEGARS